MGKGYDKDVILDLSNYNENDFDYAVNCAFELLTCDSISVNNPKCIYIGGQPGAGKSVFSSKLKDSSNSVELSLDACRMFHPNYDKIEKYIQ